MADKKIVSRQQNVAEDYNLKVYKMPELSEKSDMIAYLNKINKTADRRLRNLEVYRHDAGYKDIDKYAYAKAMRNIKAIGGNKRFSIKASESMTKQEIQKRINYTLEFLNSPSSTKSGITKVYKKRAATLNAKYGTDYTWQQLTQLFESGVFDTLIEKFASESTFRSIGKFQKNKESTIQMLNEKLNVNISNNISSAKLNGYIYRLMKDEVLDKNDLIKLSNEISKKKG